MRGALVSTIYKHGNILSEFGTAVALAMERIPAISEFCIYVPVSESHGNPFKQTTEIIPVIDPLRPVSYFRLYFSLRRGDFDIIVMNSMPTSQGASLVSNLLYLLIPLFLSKKIKEKLRILYHNSPYLNDIEKLGYGGLKSRLQTYVLKLIERRVFRKVRTFFLLESYANKIKKEIPDARVFFFRANNIAAFPSLYLNGKLDSSLIPLPLPENRMPKVLLYGFWGPQKDLRTALTALQNVKHGQDGFMTVLAGGVNVHFKNDVQWYDGVLEEFNDTLDMVMGYVEEDKTLDLFLKSNIIILPYRAVGGFSGVLSHSMFFGLSIVVPEFQEYIEQCGNYPRVRFIPVDYGAEDIASALKSILDEGNYERSVISPAEAFKDFAVEFDERVVKCES